MLQENTLTETREYKISFPVKNALIFHYWTHYYLLQNCQREAADKASNRARFCGAPVVREIVTNLLHVFEM